MKTIIVNESKIEWVEKRRNITNVIHDLPVWMFPVKISNENDCPVCRSKMRKEISHGHYIETCSIIQLDDMKVIPIHTECYNNL